MRSRRTRTPRRAWCPLAALTVVALLAAFAAPTAAAQRPSDLPIRIVEVGGDAELKVVPPGTKVPEARELTPYSLDGMTLPTESEPNDDFTTANPLGGSQAVLLGTIAPAVDVDYYSFTGLAGDRVYAATMTSFSGGGSSDSILTLYGSDGTTVIETDDDNGSFSGTSSVIAGAALPANGTYYLAVDGFSSTSTISPYHLHFRLQSGAPAPEVEPNNDLGTATPLPVSGWVTGNMTAIADPDFFSFTLNAGDSIYLALDMDPERAPANTNWNGRIGAGVFNNFLLVANDSSTVKPHAEAFFITAQEAGTFYALVDTTSATGLGADARYTLSVSVIPKQVQTDCTVIASTDVPVAIGPDVGTASSTLDVPFSVTSAATDVNLILNLTHANMPDLDVSLIAPSATSALLFTDIGASSQPGMDIGLDDNAALPIGPYTIVTDIVYGLEQLGAARLAAFNGQNPTGTWTLSIADDLNANGGTLNSWSLEVCGPPPPAYGLSLTKTVGLDPSVCATDTEITVAPGTTVYYCYTAANTGLNPLTTHDLVDDQLGTIFTGFAFTLNPGESVNTVAAGLTIPAVVSETVTNNATWTGHDGGNNASDSASATVNVPTHCGPGFRDVALAFSDFAGTFPPAGWTVTNTSTGCTGPSEWTNTNPGGRANFTGGTGVFAIADSDACGSGATLDTILTSPVLDLTGLSDPVVQFYMDYNDLTTGGTNDVAMVDVSTDGGATWTNVQTWDADFRGPLSISLPIAGAGENDVQVRWHYAQGTFDWWWEIDDAMVNACEAQTASITLDKTVGLVSGVCGIDDTLTVPIGTPVTYCYTVTNTGSLTLTSHTLVDDQLGTLFQNLPFTLMPGASAFLTVDDVVLDATTVNVATWTASDQATQSSCSAGGITITGAQGTPYPSTVTLAGASTTPTSVAVQLNGFSHTYSDDVDVLLVGPGGQNLVVMADTGGPNSVTGIDLGLADSAPIPLFDEDPLATGAYQPADYPGQSDSWPPPAPAPPYGEPQPTGTDTFTSIFGGLNPNGTWNLYVTDAFAGADDGSFTGWCLSAVTNTAEASATDSATVTVLVPDIDVTPTSLATTLDPGQTDTQQLDLANLGDGDLDWTIAEAPPAPLSIPASDGRFQRGTHADSAGMAPNAAPRSTPGATGLERILGPNTAYSWNSQNGPYYTVFDITDPANLPNITPFDPTGQFIGAGEYVDGLVYMVDVANNMWEVDPATGAILNTLVATAPPGGETYSGMALDPTSGVVYAGSTNVTTSSLFTIDVTTGTATLVGPITNCPGLIGLAIDGNGDLWGYDIVGDVLLSIDKTTGAGTIVGSIGFDANFGQGMGWHPATDTLYMAAFNGGTFQAELRSVDRATGNTTLVGVLGSTTPGGLNQLSWLGLEIGLGPCSAPSDLPWVSVNPASGTTPPGGTSTVDVTFDSTGLTPGVTYDGFLCIDSNDPDESLVEVPVTLTVTGDTMPFFGDFEEGDTSDWTATFP